MIPTSYDIDRAYTYDNELSSCDLFTYSVFNFKYYRSKSLNNVYEKKAYYDMYSVITFH